MSISQHIDPAVGNWYDAKSFPECFKVVAFDTQQALVEIQYLHGEIAEVDVDTWDAMHPHEIAEPEDIGAPYELEREDLMELLNEIELQDDATLDDHLRYLDLDNSDWD